MSQSKLNILNEYYAVDQNHVYYSCASCFTVKGWQKLSSILNGADPVTFEVLERSVARDKNYIYLEGRVEKIFDRDTFQIIRKGYFKDKNSVFRYTNVLNNIDSSSVNVLNDHLLKDHNGGYFLGGAYPVKIWRSHGPSLNSCGDNNYYAIDKYHAFYKGKIISGADPKTFEVIHDSGEIYADGRVRFAYYAKDKAHVYYEDQILDKADPKTFRILQDAYSRDEYYFYYYGDRIKLNFWLSLWERLFHDRQYPDPAKFRIINYHHSADNKYVYCQKKRLPFAVGKKFQLLGRYYAKDKKNVYYGSGKFTRIAPADVQTFKVVGQGYCIDKNYVYFVRYYSYGWMSEMIPESDGSTFELVSDGHSYNARDKNHLYLRGEVVGRRDQSVNSLIYAGSIQNRIFTQYLSDTERYDERIDPYFNAIRMREFYRIHPSLFNPFSPTNLISFDEDGTYSSSNITDLENSGNLGNYDWTIYQYKIQDEFDINKIIKDQDVSRLLRYKVNVNKVAKISYEDFLEFVTINYNGWAPYSKSVGYEKALYYAEQLLNSFLSCKPEDAIYISYQYEKQPNYFPYLVSGFYGIVDLKNNEYFELLMGGSD